MPSICRLEERADDEKGNLVACDGRAKSEERLVDLISWELASRLSTYVCTCLYSVLDPICT